MVETAETRTEREVLIEAIARLDDAISSTAAVRASVSNALVTLTSRDLPTHPFRVVGSDDVEVAASRFQKREDAENLARGMNDLRENRDARKCRPPYRVQELRWEEVS